MSLESTVASLVEASNNLTSAVTGKIKEIDNKVKAATDAVPAIIRGLSSQEFFIDAVDGKDSNDGLTSATPLKTAKAAESRVVSGSQVSLYFKIRQAHDVDFVLRVGRLFIAPYGYTGTLQSADRPLLRPVLGPIYDGWQYASGPSVASGQIFFYDVNLYADIPSALPMKNDASFIRYIDSHLSVTIHRSEITLGNIPFAGMYSGYSARDLYMSAVSISIKPGSESGAALLKNLNGTAPTVRIEGSTVQLVGITGGWASILPPKVGGNYLTNMTI